MDDQNIGFNVNSLCDRVYEYLRGKIMSGEYPPDAKLREEELASNLNVSRAPVREALNILAAEGFVVKIPRHGTVVAPVTWKEISENWDLRRLLEPYAAKTACGKIPKQELLDVQQLILASKEADDYDLYMDSDYRTHSLIYKYVSNSQLHSFLDLTMLNSMRYRYNVEKSCPSSDRIIQVICDEHLTVVAALLENDPEKAYSAMQKHVDLGYGRIRKQMEQSNYPSD